jgi:hypothetical protein
MAAVPPRWAVLAFALTGALLTAGATVVARAPRVHEQIDVAYSRTPLAFEENGGQTDQHVRFLARGPGYHVFLTPHEAVLALARRDTGSPDVLRMRLLGAASSPAVNGLRVRPGRTNYLVGRDQRRWTMGVRSFSRVRYRSVYPGVDLVFHGSRGRLEYDFRLAPRVDARVIRMTFEGARSMAVDPHGALVLRTRSSFVRQLRPVAYQPIGQARIPVSARYVVRDRVVHLALGSYVRTRPLVIDPTLTYSTYFGGEHSEEALATAMDSSGALYITGETDSLLFPTRNAFDRTFGGGTCGFGFPCRDAFVTKLDPSGTAIVYSTYLGGSSDDMGRGISVDASGAAYITGNTASANFPTKQAFQSSFAGGTCGETGCVGDAFVTKLTPAGGGLAYSTYLGGAFDDQGNGIAVDASGDAYVAGSTTSADLPTANAFDPSYNGFGDAFVTKFGGSGSTLVYSTFLGGAGNGFTGQDGGDAIAVDSTGSAYVTGSTLSTNFPTFRAFQPKCAGDCQSGRSDAFITKFVPTGMQLAYSTYLGGWDFAGNFGSEVGNGIAVDAKNHAFVVGFTNSDNFPVTAGAIQTTFGGGDEGVGGDAFVTKLSVRGRRLAFSTYLGGLHNENGLAIALSGGSAHVTGYTDSDNFPTARPIQARRAGSFDAFVSRLNGSGSDFVYSSYLGGATGFLGFDTGTGIDADPGGNTYITGWTDSTNDFPTANPLQSRNAGEYDAFMAKISP